MDLKATDSVHDIDISENKNPQDENSFEMECEMSVRSENEDGEASMETSSICEICEQELDKVLKYKSHPLGSENEIITLTYNSLRIHQKDRPVYKITDFNIYDKNGHLCPFDIGLIEAGKKLLLSGYVKAVYDESPTKNNGVATYGIGPINQWYITGFDGGEKVLIGLSSEFAEYFLLEPSSDYRVIMEKIITKINLTKIVIDFLMDNVWMNATYEDLLQRLKTHPDPNCNEETLLQHSQFICEQIQTYDAAGDINDDILLSTPCMRILSELGGVVLDNSRHVRKFRQKRLKNLDTSLSDATTTDLVKEIFESTLKDQTSVEMESNYDLIEDDQYFETEIDLSNRILRSFDKTSQVITWLDEGIKEKYIYHKIAKVGEFQVQQFDFVMMKRQNKKGRPVVAQVMRMWEDERGKVFHGQLYIHGSCTILGEVAHPRELFMVYKCRTFLLKDILKLTKVTKLMHSEKFKNEVEEEFFYSKHYDKKTSRFEDITMSSLPENTCASCRYYEEDENLKEIYYDNNTLTWMGETYKIGSAVFLEPNCISLNASEGECDVILQTLDRSLYPEYYRKPLDLTIPSNGQTNPFEIGVIENFYEEDGQVRIVIRKFYRPENTKYGAFLAYENDLNYVFWSSECYLVDHSKLVAKCYLQYHQDLGNARYWIEQGPYRFYFSKGYDAKAQEYIENIFSYSLVHDITIKDCSGKTSTFESTSWEAYEKPPDWNILSRPLKTIDLFSGCGGLTEGLRQSGVAEVKWAIEKDPNAAHAFKLNHPNAVVFTADCNDILQRMLAGEDYWGRKFPATGEVEMIVAGPPCQGYSTMNRFNTTPWSALNNCLIVTFLSYCDYYRPKYILFENVRNFVAYQNGKVLKLMLRCLLSMGYQVTFGILQAGSFGIPQCRRRFIVMAAASGCKLPQFPFPQHTFMKMDLHLVVRVDNEKYYTGGRWRTSAPYRAINLRDALADLPDAVSTSLMKEMPYDSEPKSHFQRVMRRNNQDKTVRDHICKELSPLVQERISRIPIYPGSDWRNLPNKAVILSDGSSTNLLKYPYKYKKQTTTAVRRGVCICAEGKKCNSNNRQANTLIPWCLAHTADRHNNWVGVYGRLEWDGYFSTTVANPEPLGKQGKVLHPEQHRVVSVRECARSQGFPDTYQFYGSVLDRHRQIGNAVPPPLGLALGRELQKCLNI